MQEPFRCVECGTETSAATHCGACGSRSFVLARPPDELEAMAAVGPRGAEPVPIESAPSLRRRGTAHLP